MKKNILSVILSVGLLLGTIPAMAEDSVKEITNTDMPVSQQDQELGAPAYAQIAITVKSQADQIFEGVVKDQEGNEGQANFTVSDGTYIADKKGNTLTKDDIKEGTAVSVFVQANKPMTLQYPPVYSADVVIIDTEDAVGSVTADVFHKSESFGEYINDAQTLALNIGDDTQIVNEKGDTLEDRNIEDKDIVVFYSIMTMSLPPQTTPEKIVVLDAEDGTEADIDTIKAGDKEIKAIQKDGRVFVPVREVAESLGMTVEWFDGQVLVNGVYGFEIGKDSYIKGRMVPVELGAAPEIVDVEGTGISYVPVEFFTELMEINSSVDGTALILK